MTKLDTPLTALGEKGIIRDLIRPLFAVDSLEVGLGDDAAVLKVADNLSIVLTIDKIPPQLVAQTLGVMTDRDVGRYLVVANLSDLAAMGACPIALLLSICLPIDFTKERLKAFLEGFAEASREFSVPVAGGDTAGGAATAFVAAAVGRIEPGTALRRSTAQVGDVIFATGRPGSFGTALAYFLVAKPRGEYLPPEDEAFLVEKLCHPTPRLEQGKLLRGLARPSHHKRQAAGCGAAGGGFAVPRRSGSGSPAWAAGDL